MIAALASSSLTATMQDQGVKIRNLEDEVEYLKKENKALTETLGKEGDKDVTIDACQLQHTVVPARCLRL